MSLKLLMQPMILISLTMKRSLVKIYTNREKYAIEKEKDGELRLNKGGIPAPIKVDEFYDSGEDIVVP